MALYRCSRDDGTRSHTARIRHPFQLGDAPGPIGLAVALRAVFFTGVSVSRTTTTLLALLAGWTVLAYSGQVLHNGTFLSAWREYVLIALLPAVAVMHLVQINTHRRAPPAIA